VLASAAHQQKFLSHSPEKYPKLKPGVNRLIEAIGYGLLAMSKTRSSHRFQFDNPGSTILDVAGDACCRCLWRARPSDLGYSS
jgi:hypothetical protein